MSECSCDVLLGNQGAPNCVPGHGVAKRLWQVPLKANDGTEFSIDPANLPDDAAIIALINESDPSKAVYPSALFETLTQTNADAVTEEFDSGAVEFVRDGIRSVEGLVTKSGKASPILVGQMKAARCTTFGVYLIDDCNNLVGRNKGDGLLYPFPVQSGSWIPQFLPKTETTGAKVQLNFNFTSLFRDEAIDFVSFDESTVDLLSYDGLRDVIITPSNPLVATVNLKFTFPHGAANARRPITGLVPTDLALVNTSTGNSPIGIDSLDPTGLPDGEYLLTYTALDQPALTEVVQGTLTKDSLAVTTETWTTA